MKTHRPPALVLALAGTLASCSTYAPRETPDAARLRLSAIQAGAEVYVVANSVACVPPPGFLKERTGADFQEIGLLNVETSKDPPFRIPGQFRSHLDTTLEPGRDVQILLEGPGSSRRDAGPDVYQLCSLMVRFAPEARAFYKFRYDLERCAVEAQVSRDGIAYEPASGLTTVPTCPERP